MLKRFAVKFWSKNIGCRRGRPVSVLVSTTNKMAAIFTGRRQRWLWKLISSVLLDESSSNFHRSIIICLSFDWECFPTYSTSWYWYFGLWRQISTNLGKTKKKRKKSDIFSQGKLLLNKHRLGFKMLFISLKNIKVLWSYGILNSEILKKRKCSVLWDCSKK